MKKPITLMVVLGMLLILGCGGPKGPIYFHKGTDLVSEEATLQSAMKYVGVNGIKSLKKVKKVFIPAFQVEFITKSSASASSYAMGSGGKSASVDVAYELTGLNEEDLKAVAEKAYEDFVKALQDIGLEVVGKDQVLADTSYAKIKSLGNPRKGKSYLEKGKGESIAYAPEGMSIYFTAGDPYAPATKALKSAFKGAFGGGDANKEAQIMCELGCDAMVKGKFTIGFASLSTRKGGGKASVSSSMNLTLAAGSNQAIFSIGYNETKGWKGKVNYMHKGKSANASLVQPMISDKPIVSKIQDVTSTGAKIGDAISGLFGSGSKTRRYRALANNDVYVAESKDFLESAIAMMAVRLKKDLEK